MSWANDQALDARRVSNLILDEAERLGTPLTNLALQKILYFAHALFLIENDRPLVNGDFEAWQYGPVHPVAYQAFRRAADRSINFRAKREIVLTGQFCDLPPIVDEQVVRCVHRIMASYGQLTPGRLVEISHAKDAPWHFVIGRRNSGVSFGMKIPDNVIKERFKYHKVSVGQDPRHGEPSEDTPFTRD